MPQSSRRETRSSRARRSPRVAPPPPLPLPPAEIPAPPMTELRRQATQRLRRLERLLAIVQAEHQAALAECERLKAARSEPEPAPLGTPPATSGPPPARPPRGDRQPKPAPTPEARPREEQKSSLLAFLDELAAALSPTSAPSARP